MRTHKRKLACNAVPDVSMYDRPCNGGLPLDNAFTKAFQNGGGYFLDVGNPAVIQPGVPPVQGYSECCHPVFNTSGFEGNGNFNNSGYLSSVDGNPVCGAVKGGYRRKYRKGGSRKAGRNGRATGKQSKKRTSNLYGKFSARSIRIEEEKRSKMQNKRQSTPSKGKNNQKGNNNQKGKKGKKNKGKQKGGKLPMSNFNENLVQRDLGCSQPNWNPNCV